MRHCCFVTTTPPITLHTTAEQAKLEGYDVRMLIVGEDCALPRSSGLAGRRGLAGTVLVHKICGAVAEMGGSLDEVEAVGIRTVERMGTVGVSLSPCTVPGRAPSFDLPFGEVELGLGIHGEPGALRIPTGPVQNILKSMFKLMLSTDADRSFLDIEAGDRVVLLINNLGGTSQLEMGVVAHSAIRYLVDVRKLQVERVVSGPVMTSVAMAGVTVTLLKLGDNDADAVLGMLDCPVGPPAWPAPTSCGPAPQQPEAIAADPTLARVDRPAGEAVAEPRLTTSGATPSAAGLQPRLQTLDGEDAAMLLRIVQHIGKALVAAEPALTAMDMPVGDGDCGHTMASAGRLLGDYARTKMGSVTAHPAIVCTQIASLLGDGCGGSSGALFCIGLTAAARVLRSSPVFGESVTLADCPATLWGEAMAAAAEAIHFYGGASEGDRTLLDVLYPVAAVLTKAPGTVPLPQLLDEVVAAAKAGVAKTKGMRARAGRGSYVNPNRYLNRLPDPGAHATLVWIEAVAEVLEGIWALHPVL
jgi:dihydroxyacetone kinase